MSTPSTSDPLRVVADLGPVELPAAYEVVADHLRRAIHLGLIGDGERLPSERDLAGLLGVSRVTVREALRTLQGAGYVSRRRGATNGTEVALAVPDARELRARLLSRLDHFEAVTEFRAIVEGGAAGLAAVRCTAGGLATIAAAVDALAGVTTVSAFRRADSEFHLAVALCAGNAPLEQAISRSREEMFAPIDALPYTPMVERTTSQHAAVRDAIAGRDQHAATTLMAEHVRSSHAELRDVLAAP